MNIFTVGDQANKMLAGLAPQFSVPGVRSFVLEFRVRGVSTYRQLTPSPFISSPSPRDVARYQGMGISIHTYDYKVEASSKYSYTEGDLRNPVYYWIDASLDNLGQLVTVGAKRCQYVSLMPRYDNMFWELIIRDNEQIRGNE